MPFKAIFSDASVSCNTPNPTRKPGGGAEHKNFEGFDPGSERTLAAWIRHASRTNPGSNTGGSGERGSKAWVTYPGDWDSHSNEWVIPGEVTEGHPPVTR